MTTHSTTPATPDPALANPAAFVLHAVRFGVELASLVAFFLGGRHLAGLALALAAPAAAGAVWGRWMAPKSARRLADPARIAAELAFFGAATAAFVVAGHATAAVVFGAVALVDSSAIRLPPVTNRGR